MNATDTRNRILMTAMELFWEKGYLSTSVSDILSRSQVHSGSLYHFFPGKQDVLVGVLELYRDGIDEMRAVSMPRPIACRRTPIARRSANSC